MTTAMMKKKESDLPDYEKFCKAIKELKYIKAPGEDSITAELIKHAEETCQEDI